VIRAVADTGPLLHLTEADALHLLRLIGGLHAPPQVMTEVTYHLPSWQAPEWIVFDSLEPAYAAEAAAWQQAGLLDAGEAAAIALVRQLDADWLLTDDTAARLVAEEMGLEVHGSLGLVLWAAAVGHLGHSEAKEILTRLASSSLRVSRRVLSEAHAAVDEIFSAVPSTAGSSEDISSGVSGGVEGRGA
jgi:predicted nucleic acid-binding protein